MKSSSLKRAALTAGVVTSTLAGATATQAQSVDALLDKLVNKGVLTTKEATELREESDQNFTKAYRVKSGMPEWVTALKINGDFRARYEGFFYENEVNPAAVDRQRFRYRFRLAVTATLADNFEVGLRLTSSENSAQGGDPISGNSTLQDNGSKKYIFIDQAYGKWTFLNDKPATASITLGKMENPFVSELLYDADYTPEGVGLAGTFRFGDMHTLKVGLGAFVLDELSVNNSDPFLLGAQAKWETVWNKHLNSSIGAGIMSVQNPTVLTNGAVQNIQRGNARDTTTGVLVYDFNPFFFTGSLGYTFDEVSFYPGPFPVSVVGEYLQNPGADYHAGNQAWTAGINIGKAGKKKTWELSYRYRYVGANSWYEELVDSDFGATYEASLTGSGFGASSVYGSGTNVRGHIARASYSPYNSLTLGVTYFLTTLIQRVPSDSESQTGRLQVDASLKF